MTTQNAKHTLGESSCWTYQLDMLLTQLAAHPALFSSGQPLHHKVSQKHFPHFSRQLVHRKIGRTNCSATLERRLIAPFMVDQRLRIDIPFGAGHTSLHALSHGTLFQVFSSSPLL